MDIFQKQQNDSRHKNAWGKSTTPPTDTHVHEDYDVTTLDEYLDYEKSYTKQLSKKKLHNSNRSQLFWISFTLFTLAILFAGGFFVYHTNTAINHMSDGDEKHSFVKTLSSLANPQSYKSLTGFDDGRINILLLGRANTHKSGKDLTDTIIVASINTSDYTVALLSLPRDLLVSSGTFYAKINSLYQTGLRNDVGAKYTTDSVQKITGQKIHYSPYRHFHVQQES